MFKVIRTMYVTGAIDAAYVRQAYAMKMISKNEMTLILASKVTKNRG